MSELTREIEGTLDYFSRREAQERARAETAPDPAAKRAHRELAMRYAALCVENAQAA